MAKPKRSTETLVQAIREQLDEAGQSGQQLCQAQWMEADADAGYLIHVDGRMMPMGEYQYGFDHLDDLMKDHGSDEVNGYARGEAGSIAGGLEPLTPADESDMLERIQYAFGKHADLVERQVGQGNTSVATLFELYTKRPANIPSEYGEYRHQTFEAAEDLVAAELAEDANGQLAWKTRVVLAKGQTGAGQAGRAANAFVILPEGGTVCVAANKLTNIQDVAPTRRHCGP